MYQKITIREFRQFKDTEILLGKRVTVFAGRNSTGKSTILGLLGNSGELKKKDGLTYLSSSFRAEFSEILHGSKKYDQSGSDRIQIDVTDENGNLVDYRKFRTSWQTDKGKDRFRIIPSKIDASGKKTEAKMPIPVLYLGLSRLYPIGEADEDSITAKKIKFSNESDRSWFIQKYNEILSLYDNITDVDNFSIGETARKKGIGIETDKYDYLTNSSGQDNLGQILVSILSFKNLKATRPNWNGGLLLIDEIDATLHPAAQKRLFDLLSKEAQLSDFQVVLTTHSSDLLKHVYTKTRNNNDDDNNNIELYYFSNANRSLQIKRNPNYAAIENDLHVVSILQSPNKIKVYSEDNENRWFIKKLVPDYLMYVELLDVNIGCAQLISLYKGDANYFGNTLIVFDGDVKETSLKEIPEHMQKRLNNIMKLPGTKRPEEVIYDYLISLPTEHQYWISAEKVGFNWTYFKEHGPSSSDYSQQKERERYKAWFKDHEAWFDATNLFEFWKQDNLEMVKDFREEFVDKYNSIAYRNFSILIEK